MPVPPDELDRRFHSLAQALRTSGLRLTHQRLEVVRVVAGTDEHPDVETIYRGVRARVPTISLDTVYRTLSTLSDQGLIARMTSIPGPARYDANMSSHHHFVCTCCERVRDIDSPSLDTMGVPWETTGLGTVESVEVVLRGVCRECGETMRQDPSTLPKENN